ncbi:hypothetical protein [Shinella sumterensis]|uniref:hypothetical protein n=1 Tax=Shinella sumterensis TaxID=1967501 RepID=UPI001E3E0154|nr:hypothetical protein [Shinella sumterensis]
MQVDLHEHSVFAPEPFTEREAWQWMIGRAAWKETAHRVGASVHKVPVGSFFATIREMQAVWKWTSTRRVAQFLDLLTSQNMIETRSETGKTLVTVCNYVRYQNGETHSETPESPKPKQERNTKDTNTPTTKDTSSLRSDVCPEPDESAPASSSPSVIDLPATQGQVVGISQADVAEWQSAFPAVDVPQQLRAMRQWLIANERNRKTARGMRKFVVSWLSRDQDRGGRLATFQHSQAPPQKSAFQQRQDSIYQKLKRETGDRDDEFAGTTLDLGSGDYRPH